MTHVVILGGGPAGLGAAYRLRTTGAARVTLLERGQHFGGNAGSIDWNGHRLDFGSHRLHPSCDPDVMADIRLLLGQDLLDRPRHGRIRLLGRWVHFPLKPLDLAFHLKPSFALGAALDATKKILPQRKKSDRPENFASVLEASLGSHICRHFYFPYARKIWGADPSELSAIQAKKRVSASSFGKLLRKVLGSVPGLKRPGAGRFFYPKKGFGQISDAYAEGARAKGAELHTGSPVASIETMGDGTFRVTADGSSGPFVLDADRVWSTIPSPALCKLLRPSPPNEVLRATKNITYRAMLLIYVELPVEQFTEFDAHYFPSEDVRITRLSENKNYAVRTEPRGRTVLCAELPASVDDAWWTWSQDELAELVREDLERSGLPLPAPPSAVHVARLPQAYPIYHSGYEHAFAAVDAWLSAQPGLLTYGRQGLFAHDNTHHALYMAYAACHCLGADGSFDDERWAAYRREFASHVVED